MRGTSTPMGEVLRACMAKFLVLHHCFGHRETIPLLPSPMGSCRLGLTCFGTASGTEAAALCGELKFPRHYLVHVDCML
jgi:hypothetical protein